MWVSGIKPTPRLYATWNYPELEPAKMRREESMMNTIGAVEVGFETLLERILYICFFFSLRHFGHLSHDSNKTRRDNFQ